MSDEDMGDIQGVVGVMDVLWVVGQEGIDQSMEGLIVDLDGRMAQKC
jgi:hypothetical protein